MTASHFIPLTLIKATPILLACLGGLLSELSGVVNFALEGMLLMGAFGAVWASFVTGSPWIGLMGGMAGGMLVGLLHAGASLSLRANQIVSSIALNLLAAGGTGMLLNQLFEVYGTSPAVPGLPTIAQSLSAFFPSSMPGGPWSRGLSLLVPMALALGITVAAVLKWSRWGLDLRACGENPYAAAGAGIPVLRMRFTAVVAGGALSGLGGAYLSIDELSQFVEQMSHGRGYLAIAALILGRWHPVGALGAAIFFGFCEVLSEWLAVRWPHFPHQGFLCLPYLLCVLVLFCPLGKRRPPSALGKL